MRIIEYLGAPSAGKTTLAAQLWADFKKDKTVACEFLREWATELVYAHGTIPVNQLTMYADYIQKLENLKKSGVDVVLTDTSHLLFSHYNQDSEITAALSAMDKVLYTKFGRPEIIFVCKFDDVVQTHGRLHSDIDEISKIEKDLMKKCNSYERINVVRREA